jgi:AcrR family transcriptional regulator
VPKLWDDTIEAHRRAVRDAALDATARLIAAGGPRSVTMSRIAEATGIGRATLYKYFADVDAVLLAWHERQIAGHLVHLQQLRDAAGDPQEALRRVLEAYALIRHEHPDDALHQAPHVAHAQDRMLAFTRDLLIDAAGHMRNDVPPDELARYCLHALDAARSMRSKASVRRLVKVTLDGLRDSDLGSDST